MAKVFISYSRKDIEFAKRLTAELQKSDLDFWIDWEGIPPTVDWWREIEKGIEEADIFLFLISPDSASSKVCGDEIDYAIKNAKKIIPLVARDIKGDEAPKQLSHINWIFFRASDDFDASLTKLMTAIRTDYEWAATHRRLQVKALEWERGNKESSFLLRGRDLQDAEQQLLTNASKEPHPTDLQRGYVLQSRKTTDGQRNITAGIAIAGIIVLTALAIWGWGQAGLKTINANESQRNALAAQDAQGTAEANLFVAQTAQADAENQKATAVANENEAKKQAQIALARQWIADANAVLANPNGSPETAALLSIRALRLQKNEYLPSADEILNKSLNSIYTRKILNHDVKASAVAFSPDSSQILIGYIDGSAQLIDANTGDELLTFNGFYGYNNADNNPALMGVHAVAFSQQNDKLLIASSDGYIFIQYLNSNKKQEIFANSSEYGYRPELLWSAEFSPNGEYIVIGKGWPYADPGKIEIWEIESGKQLFSFPQIQERYISHTEFSQDGTSVLSTSYDGTAILWKLNWNNQLATPSKAFEMSDPIIDGDFSSDGSMILLGLDTGAANLLKSDGTLLKKFVGHSGPITTVAFSPNGNHILTASRDNTARLWSIEEGNIIRTFAAHTDDISAAAIAPDGHSILTGSYDNTVRIWNANLEYDNQIIYGHNGGISTVAFSPDGNFILSASDDDTIRLWDAKTLVQGFIDLPAQKLIDPSFVFSAQGRWLVAKGGSWNDNGGDSTVIIWEKNGSEYKPVHVFPYEYFMQVLGFSQPNDGTESKFFYLGRGNPERYLLQTGGNWDTIAKTYSMWWWNNDVALTQTASEKAQYVAIAGEMEIQIHRIDNQDTSTPDAICKTLWDGAYGSYGSGSIAFSIDGQYLASEYLNDILIWDWQPNNEGSKPQECTQVHTLKGHSGEVLDLAFSPDGNYLLSGSADGTAILWDVKDWKQVRVLTGHLGDITSVAFSPDSKSIVTGGSDKTIRIWNIKIEDTVKLACSLLQRDLNSDERLKYGITDNKSTCSVEPEATSTPAP